MVPKFKLISSNNFDLFEERLNEFAESLSSAHVIVDIKFATAALHTTVEYTALIQYKQNAGVAGRDVTLGRDVMSRDLGAR
ncbi:MAG: hypothetical protein ACRCYY_09855 [Trueperaceae bacterium]